MRIQITPEIVGLAISLGAAVVTGIISVSDLRIQQANMKENIDKMDKRISNIEETYLVIGSINERLNDLKEIKRDVRDLRNKMFDMDKGGNK